MIAGADLRGKADAALGSRDQPFAGQGEVVKLVVVLSDRGEVAHRDARVDAHRGVEIAGMKINLGRTARGRVPGIPDRCAAWITAVVGLAHLPGRADRHSRQRAGRPGDELRAGELVVRRLGLKQHG